jgi:hypothetical protein
VDSEVNNEEDSPPHRFVDPSDLEDCIFTEEDLKENGEGKGEENGENGEDVENGEETEENSEETSEENGDVWRRTKCRKRKSKKHRALRLPVEVRIGCGFWIWRCPPILDLPWKPSYRAQGLLVVQHIPQHPHISKCRT